MQNEAIRPYESFQIHFEQLILFSIYRNIPVFDVIIRQK